MREKEGKRTLYYGSDDRHGAFAEIGQQEQSRVEKQLILIDRLFVMRCVDSHRVHEKRKQIAVHRSLFVGSLASAEKGETLRGNGENKTHEVGEPGDFSDDVFVVWIVEKEHSSVVSKPIAALFREAVANHLVD